jgi:hypothetical protein
MPLKKRAHEQAAGRNRLNISGQAAALAAPAASRRAHLNHYER